MINGQKEIWIRLNKKAIYPDTIIAISNCGRMMRNNGKIEFTVYRQVCQHNGKCYKIHRLLAKYFVPKTEDDILKKRNFIDHITHYPDNMNVNDVRNLRWCTNKENANFEEAKANQSKASLNRVKTEFGKKYLEHFGYSQKQNRNQYYNNLQYYRKYGHCKWE